MKQNKPPLEPYFFEIKSDLEKKLIKLKKRDPLLFTRVKKKISEIIVNPTHYKPLKHGLKSIRRVHLDPYVLTFILHEDEQLVEFLDFDHHDKIYL
ncbi:MAG: hypothetical protein FIB08_01015 [Candidatus Methanoperedens sp.]|nr:hypothetical protein [Candidatus Methanoperedens sp.]